jgi:REP element-mobilizing transposase RayT
MARPLRIQFPNAHYHVTCRGNARQEIVKSDGDSTAFLDRLSRSGEIYQVDVFGFVLMRNHFHLLVRTPRGHLQEFMRHFNISYTSYFNRAHHRSGHLYQGRYKAFLIDADSYLLPLYPPEPRPDAHGGEPDPGREEGVARTILLEQLSRLYLPEAPISLDHLRTP